MRNYVLPAGTAPAPALETARGFVDEFLAPGTRTLAALPLPPGAHDPLRDQHDATIIMRAALAACPADADRLVVLTDHDLFIPMLTFIFGQAQLDGTLAMVSLARLRQEFYGLPPRDDLLRRRLRKELCHELGHTLGLTHCADALCVMALSVNVAGIDIKREEPCPSCATLFDAKLETLRRLRGANKE
jgi:archaemetzincin